MQIRRPGAGETMFNQEEIARLKGRKSIELMIEKVKDLIFKYKLQRHPEGGYFAETYRSEKIVESPVNGQQRSAVTDIYFLLSKGEISRFHKVRHDEIWHFYEGAPMQIIKYDGANISEDLIGPDCPGGYKSVVPGGVYQAAVPKGEYCLAGCTVAPGFDFTDFYFLADFPEEVKNLQVNFSQYQHLL